MMFFGIMFRNMQQQRFHYFISVLLRCAFTGFFLGPERIDKVDRVVGHISVKVEAATPEQQRIAAEPAGLPGIVGPVKRQSQSRRQVPEMPRKPEVSLEASLELGRRPIRRVTILRG